MANYRMDGNYLRNASGQPVARIDGNYIRNASGQPVVRIDGDYIRNASGQPIGTLDDARKAITGAMGGITVAALWVAFIK